MKNPLASIRDLYARFERPISSLSLVGGFLFDALTLKRVDQFWENFWVLGHLFVVAVCIVLVNLEEEEGVDPTDATKAHFWLINILQFTFGGILSTFLVFYFRSATLLVSWPFLLLLAAAFAANERLKHHYARVTFQMSLFFLSLFSFAIFIVPVIVHKIGPWVFVLSGVLSLVVMWLFLLLLERLTKDRFYRSRKTLWKFIGSIYVGMNILYFTNIIPPIPLSLKDAGVYHFVEKNVLGDYLSGYEDQGFKGFFNIYEDFHLAPGRPVYAYSAVFSPASLNTTIVYNWQHYDETANRWEDEGNVSIDLIGGREGGYRTYTTKSNLVSGKWRVNVETIQGQVIGRILFNVIPVASDPPILTKINE
ncbi:MAG: hypothetical protein JWN50_193 [Parcubacteria group bacterium]|nr:hypothetical protein [Parcubacteria group bacterium]